MQNSLVANPESQIPKSTAKRVRMIDRQQRQRLFGLWKELSQSLMIEAATDREARIAYANEKLTTPLPPPESTTPQSPPDSGGEREARGGWITSWSELTRAEAGKLIYAMRRDLGRERDPKTDVISPDALEIVARLALELYGSSWQERLAARLELRPYFHHGRLDQITPSESHSLIEELLDYLARKQFAEEVRPSGNGPGSQKSEVRITAEEQKQRKEELRERFRRPS